MPTSDGIVYRQAKRGFKTALELATSPAFRLRDQPQLLEFDGSDAGLPAVLAEAIASEDDKEHLFAAWLTVAMASWKPRLIGEAQLTRAVSIVSAEPRSGNVEDRLFVAYLLADQAPAAAVPLLTKRLSDPDDRLRICAAAALSRLDPSRQSLNLNIDLLRILQEGAAHDDGVIGMVAARELVRIGLKKNQHVGALVTQLREAEDPLKFVILATLRGLGERALPALADVLAFVANEENHPFLRGYAATVAASIAPNEPAVEPVLLSLLASDNDDALQGCLTGIHVLGRVPPQALHRLRELLSSGRRGIRIAAARAIELMGPTAVEAVPQLVERCGREKEFEAVSVMADALGAIGTAAIPELLRVVRERDFTQATTLPLALMRMGVDGVIAFADAVGDEDDEAALLVLCTVVRDLAHRAGPIVPRLTVLLEKAESEDAKKVILMALSNVGPDVSTAVPSILRLMESCSDELSIWAERVLWSAGPKAIPMLEAALSTSSDELETRLVRLLGGLTAVDAHMRGYKWFEELQDDKLVRTFACIAEILDEGPASYPSVESKLRERGLDRTFSDLALGHKTLNNCITRLEALRGVRLTTAASKRKGQLTDAGRDLLRSARAYLRRRDALKRSP